MRKKLLSTILVLATATGLQAQTRVSTTAELEQALSTATSGTQIYVQAGTYQPTGTLVVPAGVRLYGGFASTESPADRDLTTNITILDGQNKFGVVLLNSGAELNGFTIQNGFAQAPNRNGGGVYAEDHTTIENCTIINNHSQLHGGGVFARGDIFVINSVISNNTSVYAGDNTFGNCMFFTNSHVGDEHEDDPPSATPTCVAPAIVSQNTPVQTREKGIAFAALSVSATGTAPLNYQWFSNVANSNNGGTAVGTDGTGATFVPPSDVVGTVYYYVVVSNTCTTAMATSAVSGLHTVTASEWVGVDPTDIRCVTGTPHFRSDGVLGAISYGASSNIETNAVTVGTLRWSEPVVVANCNKNVYNNLTTVVGSFPHYHTDCRNSDGTNDFHGHYFSWCFVMRYASQLCPSPWRVPTTTDFATLHTALGYSSGRSNIIANTYMGTSNSQRGGTWQGSRFTGDATNVTSTWSLYWSSTEHDGPHACNMVYDRREAYRQLESTKTAGYAVRCVRASL